jgi:hypothetical protein
MAFQLLPLSPQPKRNLVVVHYIEGDQGFPVMDEYHPPLSMHPDFVRTLCQLAQSQSAMSMRIAKGRANFRNGL